MTPSKNLILPAEIHSREFDARLLHGCLAVQRGWRVYVGSKALINRAIWQFPPSLYVCTTLTHKRRTMLKLLERLGHTCIGWDEEGLIYLDRDVWLMRRVSSATLRLLASVVTWGRQGAEDVADRAAAAGARVLALGNPRFDLLRPELHGLYATETAAIRRAHGDYVLINTNFASLDPIVSLHDLKPRMIARENKPNAGESARFAKFLDHRRAIYARFLADLPRFTALHPGQHFVLRAHPGENEETWKERFRGQAHVAVTREGPSIPWLIACKALVHNGCTTAVEAALMGHTPIAYCPVESLDDESALANPVSHRVRDFGSLADAMHRASAGTLPMRPAQRQILDKHVSAIDGPMSCSAILDHCDALIAQKPAKAGIRRLAYLAFARLRDIHKGRRRGHITDRYLSKVFPPLDAAAVARRVDQIASVIGRPDSVRVRAISANIFELSLAGGAVSPQASE